MHSFASLIYVVVPHAPCRWLGRALVACASQGPKAFANATENVLHLHILSTLLSFVTWIFRLRLTFRF
jgi:hypothetical protein